MKSQAKLLCKGIGLLLVGDRGPHYVSRFSRRDNFESAECAMAGSRFNWEGLLPWQIRVKSCVPRIRSLPRALGLDQWFSSEGEFAHAL